MYYFIHSFVKIPRGRNNMTTIKKVKRLEKIIRATPAVALLASIATANLVSAAAQSPAPNEICIDGFCFKYCYKWWIIKICV